MKKLIKLAMSALLLISSFTMMPQVKVLAEGAAASEKISDASTVNAWESLFVDDNTDHAGGIWTDKSVFNNAQDYVDAIHEYNGSASSLGLEVAEDNFLVSLSAIASTKSIVGYSSIPTDTMLVLDLSTSMINNRSIDELTKAANKAMQELFALNNHNRVGVVVYAGNTTGGFSQNAPGKTMVLLPLDRYTATVNADSDPENTPDFLHYKKDGNSEWNNMYIADGVRNSSGKKMDGEMTTSSGTFIQDGIYVALQQFLRSDIESTIPEGQVQAGTERIPIMVIMTDGEPTLASRDYDGNAGKLGSNELNYQRHGYHDITFLSQLTASYAKQEIDKKYAVTSPLFYTLGLNVDESVALVMNPDPNYEGADASLKKRFNDYWNALKENGRVTMTDARVQLSYDAQTIKDLEAYRSYSDGYYPAENQNDLMSAFDDIVKEIILQSMYYPTLVDTELVQGDGYLTFIDYIGDYMEVKSIKGIQLGGKLYNGSKLAQLVVTGAAGDVSNPKEMGDNLVWALTQRLGLDRSKPEDIQTVRNLLQKAYDEGQISYNISTGEFSNYVGWYGDSTGKFVGFWDGDASYASAPANASTANKSYLYLDAVGAGHRETDILYASIQISTAIKQYVSPRGVTIKENETLVYYRLPASLIPLVEYHVSLEGTDATKPIEMRVEGATAPTRLLYEVGLDDRVDLLNLASTASGAYNSTTNKYEFYTNQWTSWNTNNPLNAEPWEHNAYAMFEPSLENEHYYFNEKTQIYSDTNGTPASSIVSGNSYYYRHLIYTANGSSVSAEYEYLPISSFVLENNANLDFDGGAVYVKKGVIHRYVANHVTPKAAGGNKTETLSYSSQPFVHHESSTYHIDDMLGNNGKLTVDPYEGIKLTKEIDSTLLDDGTKYTFVLEADVANQTYTLVKEDRNGNRVFDTLTFDAAGKAEVQLEANETLYLLSTDTSSLIGKQIKVTEVETSEYKVSKINETAVTKNFTEVSVVENIISDLVFTNTKLLSGEVTIEKTVVSEHDEHKKDLKFNFDVVLTSEDLKESYPADLVVATDTGVVVTSGTVEAYTSAGKTYYRFKDSHGQVDYEYGVQLTHNDYLHIYDLPVDTYVLAEEKTLPEGFELNASASTTSAVVEKGIIKNLHFINEYVVEQSDDVQFTLNGEKNILGNITGTPTLTFNFKLEKLNEYGVYEAVKDQYNQDIVYTVTYTGAYDTAKTFGETLALSFAEEGTYSYRIVEVLPAQADRYPGMVYDPVECVFNVVVKDNAQGKLVIQDVLQGNDTQVSVTRNSEGNVTAANVSFEFNNEYHVDGAAEVIVNIGKEVVNTEGDTAVVSPAGFVFELYESDSSWALGSKLNSLTTDASGKTVFNQIYAQDGDASHLLGKDYYYILKEKADTVDTPYGTLQYDPTEYRFYVKTGVAAGTNVPSVELTITKVTDSASELVYQTTGVASTSSGKQIVKLEVPQLLMGKAWFTNLYTPDAVSLTIPVSGVKTFTGWPQGLAKPVFTFEMYKSDEFGNYISADLLATQTVSGSGNFTFNETGTQKYFTKTGTYYAVVKESIPAFTYGINYDPTEYLVRVDVTADAKGKLTATVVSITAEGKDTVIEFKNTYEAVGTEVQFKGTKTLTSDDLWILSANMFSFELYATDASFSTAGLAPVQRVSNAADGQIVFDKLMFAQSDLNNETSKEYYYVIKELIPAGADSSGTLNGLTFDKDVYEIKLTVTDMGQGALEVEAEINGSPASLSSFSANFENKYQVASASTTIEGIKTLTGALISQFNNEFEIELYHATVTGSVWTAGAAPIASVHPDAAGKFEFKNLSELSFTKPGDYYFIVKEKVTSTDPNYLFDGRNYHVTVNVADNMDGTLAVAHKISLSDDPTELSKIEFANRILPEAQKVVLNGSKTLTGWPSDAGVAQPEFIFELYEAEADGLKIDLNPGTSEIDPIHRVSGQTGFEFKDLDKLTFTAAGTYYFVINEQIPADVDAELQKNGITYDAKEYLVKVEVTKTSAESSANGRDTLEVQTTTYLIGKNGIEEAKVSFENKYMPETKKEVFLQNHTFNLDGRAVSYGDVLTYQITYIHPESAAAAAEVKIVDTLPAGVEYVPSSATSQGVYQQGELTWTLTNVAPGETRVVNFDVKVVAAAGTEINNAADIFIGNNKFTTNETSNYTVTEKDVLKDDGSGNLVSVDGQPVLPNEILTYQIRYVNASDAVAETVIITDVIPANTEYVAASATSQGVYDNGEIEWTLKNVAPNETRTVTFQVKVVASNAARLENQGSVSIGGNKYNTNTVYNYVVVKETDKTYVNVDEEVNYTINYINYTEDTADVIITDSLDAALTVIQVNDGGVYDPATHTITWAIADVASYAEGEVSFTAKVNQVLDSVDNKAQIQVGHEPSIETNVTSLFVLKPVSFEAAKLMDGRPLSADEFEFALYKTDSTFTVNTTALQLKKNDAVGKVYFDEVEFEDLGTYYFVIKEVAGTQGGVTYDVSEYHIAVTLSAGAQKVNVDTTIVKNGIPVNAIEFKNAYGLVPGAETTVVLEGVKHLTGRVWNAQDQYEFELYETTSEYNLSSGATLIDTVTVDMNGHSFAFNPLTYTAVGTHYFVMREVKGTLPGVDYDEFAYQIEVVVKDNGNGQLIHEVKLNNSSAAKPIFTNDYTITPAAVVLNGTKTLQGRPLNASEFTFVLYESDLHFENRHEIARAQNDANGNFSFEIKDKQPGTYYYVLNEEAGALGGITYDEAHYHVVVTVEDDTQGSTTYTVSYVKYEDGQILTTSNDKAEFVNHYQAVDNIALNISSTKILQGREAVNGEFAFELYETDHTYQVDSAATAVRTTINKDGLFTFEHLTYTQPGDYYYVIKEVNSGTTHNGVSYTTEQLKVKVQVTDNLQGELVAKVVDENGNELTNAGTLTNSYQANSINVELAGIKTLFGRSWSNTDEFTFELYAADEYFTPSSVLATATVNESNKTFVFKGLSELQFNRQTTAYFVVAEQQGSIPGIEYDKTVFGVKVTVTDNLDGTLSSVVQYYADGYEVDAIEFDNFYEIHDAAETSLILHGTKDLTGRSLHSNEFSFELYKTDDVYQNAQHLETVHNVSNVYAFSPLTYTKAMFEADKVDVNGIMTASYYYIVKETAGSLPGVAYDTGIYYIKVDITDDGVSGLHRTVTMTDAAGNPVSVLAFHNTYTFSLTPIQISGEKKLTGRQLNANEFAFVLYESDSVFSHRVKVAETTADAAGNFSFAVANKAPGRYYFVLNEENGTLSGVTYDKSHYHIVVDVTDNGAGYTTSNLVSIEKIVEHDGSFNVEHVTSVVFENSYKAVDTDGLVLAGVKHLAGREQINGEFVFELYSTDAAYMVDPAASPLMSAFNVDGTFKFDALKYETAGTYHYVVKEKDLAAGGMTYDTNSYQVEVTVVDNGSGELVATAQLVNTPETTIAFNNTYSILQNVETVISGTKEIAGRQWLSTDQFTFELIETASDFAVTQSGQTVTVDQNNPSFEFKLQYDAEATHYYVLKENAGTIGGMTYDAAEYHIMVQVIDNHDGTLSLTKKIMVEDELTENVKFTNHYKANSTKDGVSLSAQKHVEGRPLFDGEFSFELYQTDASYALNSAPVQIVKNDAAGNIKFAPLHFDQIGTFHYVVKETVETLGGITYDDAIYQIVIEVKDRLDGYYQADVVQIVKSGSANEEVSSMVFKNKYQPAENGKGIVLEAIKKLDGKTLNDGEFTFQLFAANQNYTHKNIALQNVKNSADGKVVFDELKHTSAGTYYYVIRELNDGQTGITYDSTEYHIEVLVTDNYYGELKSEIVSIVKGTETVTTMEFNNKYERPNVPVTPEVPSTSDNSNLMMHAGISLLSLLAAIWLRLQKKRYMNLD